MKGGHAHHGHGGGVVTDVVHHVLCRSGVEVEVWPAHADVSFRDDRGVNPATTQTRFEAAVYNARSAAVTWEVRNLAGQPGAGSIDAGGLYQAPPKGAWPSGHTDVVIATAVEDPLRKAFAWVTLVGVGPAPAPPAVIDVWPKTAYLYYSQNTLPDHRNELIDDSNRMQVFRATPRHAAPAAVEWLVNNVLQPTPSPSSLFRLHVTGAGSTAEILVTARLAAQPSVQDHAKVIVLNYTWPKMRPLSQL